MLPYLCIAFIVGLMVGVFAGVNYMRIQTWKYGIVVKRPD